MVSATLRRAAVVAAAALLATGAAARAHDLHMTMTVIDTDARTGALTLTVRGFADDLGAAAAAAAHIAPAPDHSVPDSAMFAYLQRSIAVTASDGAALPLAWCGLRRADDVVFACVRTSPRANARAQRLRQAMMFERFADQVNVVRVQRGGEVRTVIFSHGDGAKPLP